MKKIKIGEREYMLQFPTVGQFIDIKVLEAEITKGHGNELVFGTGDQQMAFIYATIIANFTILCPQLLKDMKVKSYRDLSLQDFEMLVEVYTKEIQPWISSVKRDVRDAVTTKGDE